MNLYSRRKFLASTALVLVCAGIFTSAVAQRRKAHKLRATAVVEVTTDSSGKVTTRILPVTVLDEGQFRDASLYKATPRPMALDNGIVYEAQTTGIPVGTATILNGANNNGWTALGKWQIVTAAKKSEAPPSAVTTDDRPTLHRAAGSGSSSSTDSSNPASSNPAPSSTPAPGSSPSSSSDDRPTLHRPTESAPVTPAPSNTSTPTPTPAASSTPASSGASQSTADNAPTAPSEDPDRPTLKRHNAKEQGPPQPPAPIQSTQSKPASAPEGAAAAPKAQVAAPGTTKTFVAVSDTEPTDVRSFEFKWNTGEEAAMELKMRKLALAQIPKEDIQHSKESTQLTTKSLRNVVMRSFDLDLSNDAVLVLSAEVPATVPSTKESSAKFISRYVTVVARVDFEGVPQKVLASVTDSSRLDVSPRLELIDAVDVNGDGLAELLFREYGYDDKSFVIYSVGRSTVTKVFEGASRPLP